VILSLIASDAAVGRYGSAYRLFESTFFLTYALIAAFSPMCTYLERDSEPSVQAVFARSIKLALLLLVPCAAVFGVLAPWVCRTIFGHGLAAAAPSLRILAPAVVLIGLVTLATSLIVSRRSPTSMVWLSGGMTLFNIVLNLILIPGLHERGAAIAMLATEAVFLVLAFRMALATIDAPVRWLPMTAAPLLAGALMAAVMLLLRATVAVEQQPDQRRVHRAQPANRVADDVLLRRVEVDHDDHAVHGPGQDRGVGRHPQRGRVHEHEVVRAQQLTHDPVCAVGLE